MSKSDRLYLELQDKANELGFESVEEAKASGYKVVGIDLVKSAETAMLEAHIEWEKKKDEVLASLKNAIEFIEHECVGRI